MSERDEARLYFSERQGRGPKAAPLPFESVRRLAVNVLDGFRERDYFQEAFGYWCVDAEQVNGTVGGDPAAYFLRAIMRDGVWPYWEASEPDDPGPFGPRTSAPPIWKSWDADTLFDVIEVLHDLVSEPTEGRYHDYASCGWHYTRFNRISGQEEFRREMNSVLRLNDPSYAIDGFGQIIETAPEGFSPSSQHLYRRAPSTT